jgi:hypothetical protein
MEELKKIQVSVPLMTYEMLEKESAELGVSIPSVIKMGIRLYFENRAMITAMGKGRKE